MLGARRRDCCSSASSPLSWTNAKPDDPVHTAFAISFPASKSGKAATYTVNNVYSDEYGADYEPEA